MNEVTRKDKAHQGQIMDLQTDKDLTFLISSSKDCTAKVKRIKSSNFYNKYLFLVI
jgi:hypothetical protein